MRAAVPLLVAFVAGGAVVFLLLRRGQPDEVPVTEIEDPYENELEDHPHVLATTSVLVVRARAPDGKVPYGTEVGYEYRGVRRLLYAGEDGARHFTDAPVGRVVVIASAPGHTEARQDRTTLAGVPMEVPLTLQPEGE